MSRVGVRPAAPDDVDALVDLFVAVVDEGRWLGTQPPVDRAAQRRRFLEHIDDATGSASLVAVADHAIVGHAGVDMTPYKVAGLGMMVDARWRSQGVGDALVRAVIDATRVLGTHKLALQVWPHNDVAHRLYLRHGSWRKGCCGGTIRGRTASSGTR